MLSIKVYSLTGQVSDLHLLPGTVYDMELLLPTFDDKLEGADFSLPSNIPMSNHNRKVLGFPEHFNTHSGTIPEYWRCDVYDANVLLLQDAKLKLLNHNGSFDARNGNYNFNISGTKGFMGSRIKNKKLNDLQLDGIITWAAGTDSREFAKDLIDGNQPQYADRLSFAPVAMTEYFDNTRNDYAGEFIIDEIVNNIIVNGVYPNGWIFGRYKTGSPTNAVGKGTPEYTDYRTVPFYNLFYVVKKIFTEHGFTVDGTFFDAKNLDQLYIFNNYAIERYDYPFTFDLNTQIEPANHMPDQLISEFLAALQNTFNLKIIFSTGFKAMINFKEESLASTRIKDVTGKIHINYENSQRHESFYGGLALKWSWDSADSYHNDRVKEMKGKNIIAEANTLADLITMVFAFTLDNTHFALVQADNYFYNYNPSLSVWEPYSENQGDYEEGQMEFAFQTELSPLCQHYAIDIPLNQIVNKNKCGTRMPGSYLSIAKEQVQNPFQTRIFYIQKMNDTLGSYTDMPFSFSHNYDSNGVKLVETSLSWKAVDGLYNRFWKRWLEFLKNSFTVNTLAYFNATDIGELNASDILKIGQSMFLLKKLNLTLPMGDPSEVELVKL